MTTESQSETKIHKRGWKWWVGRVLLAGLLLILILVGITWVAGNSAKAELAEQYPAPGELVDIGGYNLHIDCVGQGEPTVIMDAGNNDFSVQWALVQPEVAKFARVCVYDRAGFGWGDPSPHARTSTNMVDELHTLLTKANVQGPYVLVGHSFGGLNMRLFAHQYPDEVVGLLLVDSAHEEQTSRVVALQQATDQALGQFRNLAQMSSLGLLALSPDEIPTQGLPGPAAAQYRAILATTDYFETAVAETEALEESFAEVRAANITSLGDMPLIVLSRGLNDPLPNVSAADNQQYEQVWQTMQSELTGLSSNSEQIIADQSGHRIQLQQPQLVIDAIKKIVQETQQ